MWALINTILVICLFTAIYETITIFVTFPDKQVEKKISRLRSKIRKKQSSRDSVLLIRVAVPLLNYFKNTKIFNYNETKMRNHLEKAGINETPEVFLAKGLMYSMGCAALALLFLVVVKNSFLFLLFAVTAAIAPFMPTMELKSKIGKINDGILKEFPAFVTALRHQYGRGKTLNDIVQSYIEVAGPGLRYELQKLSAELEMMSDSDALLRFADRVELTDISNFAHALVFGQMYGMKIDNIFAIQDQEMRRLNRDNIRKSMKRKPVMLTIVIAIPVINILLIFGVPPLVNMFTSIKF